MYTPKAWKEKKGEYTYAHDFLDRLTDTVNPDGSHERQMRDGEGRSLKKVHPNAYGTGMDDGEILYRNQLIPVNIIAYRSQYGSANPAAVIAPAIVATFFSSVVAVVYCKIMDKRQGA